MNFINFLLDLYENIRKTNTNKDVKIENKKYDFEAGFTGRKKADFNQENKKMEKRYLKDDGIER